METRILVIETESRFLEAYGSLLTMIPGVNIDCCASLEEYQDTYASELYDLAVIGICPTPNNASSVKLLGKLCEAHPETEVVAISHLDDEFTVRRLVRMGIRGFVSKKDDFMPGLRVSINSALLRSNIVDYSMATPTFSPRQQAMFI